MQKQCQFFNGGTRTIGKRILSKKRAKKVRLLVRIFKKHQTWCFMSVARQRNLRGAPGVLWVPTNPHKLMILQNDPFSKKCNKKVPILRIYFICRKKHPYHWFTRNFVGSKICLTRFCPIFVLCFQRYSRMSEKRGKFLFWKATSLDQYLFRRFAQ